nr:MAG: major capsid protein [Microvirus sp.]
MALKRSKQNLSHYVLQSMDMGKLVPCGNIEVLPGDSFQHKMNALIRLSPLNTPVMHPVHVTMHCWFVPHRHVWNNWESFITGGETGTDASVFPTITPPVGGFPVGSLGNYLGIQPEPDTPTVSALPFRAYAQIYNHFYRDEQLQTPLVVSKADGADTTTNTTLQDVAWNKDYFTSARPEPQLGPDVYLPLGTKAPVMGLYANAGNTVAIAGVNAINGTAPGSLSMNSTGNMWAASKAGPGTGSSAWNSTNANVYADLTTATSVTINDLRKASAFQRFYERMNRAGARYDEYLLSLGVKSSDARLQLPEYLGGVSQTVQFSEVLQTAEGTNPVGTMNGHGISALGSGAYTRFFEEHGTLLCLMYIRPVTMYTSGLHRSWSRRTKFDFWQPELQHVGDQEILRKEIYCAPTGNDSVFGYAPRYQEYRTIPSRVAGEFLTTLDTWHMARKFASAPALNADFVKANPTTRIFADTTSDTVYVYLKHNLVARRLVSKRGNSFLS